MRDAQALEENETVINAVHFCGAVVADNGNKLEAGIAYGSNDISEELFVANRVEIEVFLKIRWHDGFGKMWIQENGVERVEATAVPESVSFAH
jgi:hypothetical protein